MVENIQYNADNSAIDKALFGGTLIADTISEKTSGSGVTIDGVLCKDGYTSSSTHPSFLAFVSATQSDVTGDGTAYTIVANTEVFDQASNYNNSTGVFTAPITGKYRFSGQVNIQGMSTSHLGRYFNLVTTARTYGCAKSQAVAGNDSMSFSILCDMVATDTAYMTINVTDSTKVVDVQGGATTGFTYFSGELVC